mmetsp:Transcript_51385/g.133699  ORF Transcript_51385/g.133699 Transcript_51385/m.133699 type:complete len:362 (-) Transcript_51385:495-1580(-)
MISKRSNPIVYSIFLSLCDIGALSLHLKANGTTPCDLTKGRWQMSAKPPLYDISHVDGEFKCPRSKSDDITKYAWVPDDCELPLFNASKMQHIFSRRPIFMVGDSLVRNTYESLRMLMPTVDNIHFDFDRYLGHRCGAPNEPAAKEQFPIERDHDSLGLSGCAVDLDEISTMGKFGKLLNSSILMLGGGHHFARRGNTYHYRDRTLEDTGGRINIEAFTIAIELVFRTLEKMAFTGDVILQTYSPGHFFHGDWDSHGSCNGQTGPVNNISEYADLGSASFSDIEAVNSMLRSTAKNPDWKFGVRIFDITAMSWGRADAHPGEVSNDLPGKITKNDCQHWCLPGVPDVWNQALLHILSDLFA